MSSSIISRRQLMLAATATVATSLTGRANASTTTSTMAGPCTALVLDITCTIAPVISMGLSPVGERRIVPITGGSFVGNHIKGTVLPGGADRQLIRRDGFKQLHATYELQTDDGFVLSVSNRVLIPAQRRPGEMVFSQIELTAEDGPYDWINQHVYVGTLTSLQPGQAAVRIGVYKLVAPA